MEKPVILHVESSHGICSVMLSSNQRVLYYQESEKISSHQENLPVLIKKALSSQNIDHSSIDALHICGGPGSYTGLRIGFSIIMGMAFASDTPVILSSANEILFRKFRDQYQNLEQETIVYTAITARPNEVYSQSFSYHSEEALDELSARVIDSNTFSSFEDKPLVLIGSGANNEVIKDTKSFFKKNIQLDALMMLSLGERKFKEGSFTPLYELNPLYLKPPRIMKSRKKWFG